MFISYSHQDHEFVELLARGLRLAGVSFWRDVEKMSGGQSPTREVEIAIENSTVFVVIVSEHLHQSKWLRHEIARAIDEELFVVPVVFAGAKVPVTLSDSLRIQVLERGPVWSPNEIFRVVEEIQKAVGWAAPPGFDEFDPCSSDCDWDETDELASMLTGTRWSWCHNGDAIGDEMWIEFSPGGELKRSWKPLRGPKSPKATWKVVMKRVVVYGGHALFFDLERRLFRGVVAFADRSDTERSGRLLAGSLEE